MYLSPASLPHAERDYIPSVNPAKPSVLTTYYDRSRPAGPGGGIETFYMFSTVDYTRCLKISAKYPVTTQSRALKSCYVRIKINKKHTFGTWIKAFMVCFSGKFFVIIKNTEGRMIAQNKLANHQTGSRGSLIINSLT